MLHSENIKRERELHALHINPVLDCNLVNVTHSFNLISSFNQSLLHDVLTLNLLIKVTFGEMNMLQYVHSVMLSIG